MPLISTPRRTNPSARRIHDEWLAAGEAPLDRATKIADLLRPFEQAFRRRDQVLWFNTYTKGLLRPGTRKTIEAMVRSFDGDIASSIADPSQALQNFLNQSPWDEQRLWRELRRAVKAQTDAAPLDVVIEEVGIVKQGQHSVGVHRQYAGDSDRKQNCQVAILVLAMTSAGPVPIACRLYLPKHWSSDPSRLTAAGVPDEFRQSKSRGHVALSLLDEIRADGLAIRTVVAATRHSAPRELRDGLELRQLPHILGVDDEFPVPWESRASHPNGSAAAVKPIRDLQPAEWSSVGTVRYAGQPLRVENPLDDRLRPWALMEHAGQGLRHFLGQLDDSLSLASAASILASRKDSQTAVQSLKDDFGLDHFEGRSWRGFHHHAALVALAAWIASRVGPIANLPWSRTLPQVGST